MKVETPREQLFFATVQLEVDKPNDTSVGTGFIVRHTWHPEKSGPFLVTNKHVVKDATKFRFSITQSDGSGPVIGSRHNIELTSEQISWFGHPDMNVDVAALPLAPLLLKMQELNLKPFYRAITSDLFLNSTNIEQLDAIEEVLFIGYPNGILDQKNGLPIARRGTTASPLTLDYNGLPAFLIDASVFPGSSGSPVFICDVGSFSPRGGGLTVGSRTLLLGLVSSVLIRNETGSLKFVDIPTALVPKVVVPQMIDIGIVFKAHTIVETINALLKKLREI